MPFVAEQAAGHWGEYHADSLLPEVKDKKERIGDASIAIGVYSVTLPPPPFPHRHKTQIHTHIQYVEGRGSPLSRSFKVMWYTPATFSVRKVSGTEV